jgi:hypothetical protein
MIQIMNGRRYAQSLVDDQLHIDHVGRLIAIQITRKQSNCWHSSLRDVRAARTIHWQHGRDAEELRGERRGWQPIEIGA